MVFVACLMVAKIENISIQTSFCIFQINFLSFWLNKSKLLSLHHN